MAIGRAPSTGTIGGGVTRAPGLGPPAERKRARLASQEASLRREAREVTATADDTRSWMRRGCGRIRLAKVGTAARARGQRRASALQRTIWKKRVLDPTAATAAERRGRSDTVNREERRGATSHQLPRNAAGAVRAADARPRPPDEIGKVAWRRTHAPTGPSRAPGPIISA